MDQPQPQPQPQPRPASPPSSSRGPLVLAVLIVAVGTGWLLTALTVGPGINWVWTLGLGTLGVVVFILSRGLDKFSAVVGPFLLAASVLSIFRQGGAIPLDVGVPILVILFGVLMLVSLLPAIPAPSWYGEPPVG